jgi:hypothetical protein
LILEELGLNVFAQISTPGLRGVDLFALAPDDAVLAIEVKGTLRAGTIPPFARGRERQMSVAWLNDRANAAMMDWELEAADTYGALVVVDFPGSSWRAALAFDFEWFVPVRDRALLRVPNTLAPH